MLVSELSMNSENAMLNKPFLCREARLERRHRTEDYAVQFTTAGETGLREACVVDVSGEGLRLRTKKTVRAGRSVTINLPDLTVIGNVRYCVENEAGGFDSGIHVESTYNRSF